MTLAPTWIGIDVSKGWLDVAMPSSSITQRIPNTAQAIAAFAAAIAPSAPIIVLEATGVYDRVLRHQLGLAGIGFRRVNPQRARDFARATGKLAKTDSLDAAMLAHMGQTLKLTPDPLPDPVRDRLSLLSKRRDQLVGMRTQEKLRRIDADDSLLVESLDHHLGWLEQAITAIEVAIHELIAHHQELSRDNQLIRSVPGIGPVTSAVLVALMPELGKRPARQIAALAGLAPLNQDSGTKRGQRTIGGGRRRVRQALYMAAVASLTAKSPLTGFYKRLRDTGKPAKVALIALARKLLTIVNAIIKTQTPFRC